ncbi:MAG TPA: TolC family protein, partial [Verrucomicrobiae bacterium]
MDAKKRLFVLCSLCSSRQITKWLPRGAHWRLKFDESRRLPQNHSMKRTGILSVIFAAAAAVAAQSSGEFTPVPPPSNPQLQAGAQPVPPPRMPSPPADAGTNAPAAAGTNAPMGGRMSLLDCIQATLAHNFDVQIERYNPQISLYNLNAAYSGYDPSFTASGQHDYSVSGGGLNQNHQPIPASVSDGNSFRTGLGGLLPLGLQYNLTGSASDTYGASGVSGFENSSSSAQVSLTQPLLKNFWIDSTRLNIRVAKNRLKFSEQGLRQQLITSVTAVANAYYELIYAQQNVQVQQQALDLAQTQLNQDNQRVQIGTLAVLSVQQDESQAAQSKANLIAAQSTL